MYSLQCTLYSLQCLSMINLKTLSCCCCRRGRPSGQALVYFATEAEAKEVATEMHKRDLGKFCPLPPSLPVLGRFSTKDKKLKDHHQTNESRTFPLCVYSLHLFIRSFLLLSWFCNSWDFFQELYNAFIYIDINIVMFLLRYMYIF